MQYLEFLTQSFKYAAQIAKSNFGNVVGTTKAEDNNQVLTATDLEIGSFIISQVEKYFPEHNIIDEEAGVIDKGSKLTWVIDPIDGTSNFAVGSPNYGIIIGLLEAGTPIAGGFALPFFDEIFLAERGKGARCNGELLQVSKEERLLSSLVAYYIGGHQEDPRITREECKIQAEIILGIRNMRNSGSIFDGMMVAKGKYGAYLNQSSKIWDNIGQQIVIEEAGGLYTDFYGQPIDYSNPLERVGQNFTYCCGAPQIHRQLQEIIHRSVDLI